MVRLAFQARQMEYGDRLYWPQNALEMLKDMARQTTQQQVSDLATQVFGSKRAAMALEQCAPAKLLETAQGHQVVYTLLQQLEYCVYV